MRALSSSQFRIPIRQIEIVNCHCKPIGHILLDDVAGRAFATTMQAHQVIHVQCTCFGETIVLWEVVCTCHFLRISNIPHGPAMCLGIVAEFRSSGRRSIASADVFLRFLLCRTRERLMLVCAGQSTDALPCRTPHTG